MVQHQETVIATSSSQQGYVAGPPSMGYGNGYNGNGYDGNGYNGNGYQQPGAYPPMSAPPPYSAPKVGPNQGGMCKPVSMRLFLYEFL
jgi:hypothetical protein